MRWKAAFAALSCTAVLAAAAGKYEDPDAPATLSAAKTALPSAKALDIVATTLDIVGVTRGIEGALKDLNAKVTGREIRIELSADVLFDFDKADLKAEAIPSLRKVAEVLRATPNAPVTIDGHTDGKGTDAYNQPLSERRAKAVKDWLVREGAAQGSKITARGWGKSKPLVPNTRPDGSDDPEGRKKNRRVDITVRTG